MAESVTQYQKVKEITEQLEAGIQDLFQSGSFRTWLTTMSRFHNYSLNNTILISMQKPEATLVAGYNTWQDQFGRQVKKGEKGIRILAPAPIHRSEEADHLDPETGRVLYNPDGTVQKEKREILIPAYKVVSVFDISSTIGKAVPFRKLVELDGTVEQYDLFLEGLKRTCPVPVSFELMEGESRGYYQRAEERIAVKEGMSQVQTVKTLIHEMAHQKMHSVHPDPGDPGSSGSVPARSTMEIEAEAVAYTVCAHYGIDVSDYSFTYIAAWSQGKDTSQLRESMDQIRRAASGMIGELNGHLTDLRREKAQWEAEHRPKEKPAEPGLQENGRYRYYSTQRPVEPGSYPKLPANPPVLIENFGKRIPVEGGRMEAWGYLEYALPLTEAQRVGYELKPSMHWIQQREQPAEPVPEPVPSAGKEKPSVLANLYALRDSLAGTEPAPSAQSRQKEVIR